jgi:hypothetical protein
VTRHVCNRPIEARRGLDVTDRAEKANNDIEPASEIEVEHVAMMEGDPWMALACDLEHPSIEVDPFDSEGITQIWNVTAGAAGYVEQRIAGRALVLLDQLAQARALALVVFPAMDRVI